MILYFAGAESEQMQDHLKKGNANAVLQSAYYLNYKRAPNSFKFGNFLLDSGGYTLRKFNKSLPVSNYAEYLNNHKVGLSFNLDTNDVEETLRNQKYLEQNTDSYIIPVYHYSDYADPKHRYLIQKYSDEYPLISIAGAVAPSREHRWQFMSYCFNITKNKTRVHGLAATGIDILYKFPFYSVDSTTWLNPAKFGSTRLKKTRLLKQYESKMVDYRLRLNSEIKCFLKLQDDITELWKARGVTWATFRK